MDSTERFQQAMEVFDRVCDAPAESRAALLDEACGDDDELRREVESLLAHDTDGCEAVAAAERGDGANFLAAGLAADAPHDAPPLSPRLPERIGQFRVLRMIGQGGMGAVYEARQENPNRRVALKVIRSGLMSEPIVKRFQLEAQVLGLLQHPGIAHIYEAGYADIGADCVPYFAMEFIDGVPLNRYAADRNLDTRQKLALTARVADAVQHAHQKGIVHRDLKPGNILVVEQDAATDRGWDTRSSSSSIVDDLGQPKILDFGIARVTDADFQTVTVQTNVGELVGTLAYMSPEQVAGHSRDLDTRCDVYALGVILYELVTGRLPFDLAGIPITEAARIIREKEPPRVRTLNASLPGDVDTIIAKAMEKDRERRYASAAELAADIRRYLLDEPIAARPASTFYQLRKFARRNRGLVGGIVATMLAVIIGSVFAVYFAVRANRNAAEAKLQEREAIAQKDSSDAVTDFLAEMLAAANPEAQDRHVTVLEALDAAAAKIDDRFDDQPLVEAKIRHTIGETYVGLGEYKSAEEQLSAALKTRTDLLDRDHRDTILTQIKLGEVYYYLGRLGDATRVMETVLDRCRHANRESDEVITIATHDLAFMYMQSGRHGDAEPLFKQAIDRASAMDMESELLLEIQSNLALLYDKMKRPDEAAELYQSVIEASKRARRPDHPVTLLVMANLATVFSGTGRHKEAFALLEQVLDAQRRALGERHSKTLITLLNLGHAHRYLGRFDSAEQLYREGMATARAAYDDEHPSTLMFQLALGGFLQDFNRYDEARPLLTKCFEQSRKTLGDDHPRTRAARQRLDKVLDAIKNRAESNASRSQTSRPVRNEK